MEPQVAASTISSVEQSCRATNFDQSLPVTQFELEGAWYTVRKLWMSSFKCHKWHLILTSEQRVMIVQSCSIQHTWAVFFQFWRFSKFKLLPNQIKWFFVESFHTSYTTYLHQIQGHLSIKNSNQVHETNRAEFGHFLRNFSSVFFSLF